LVNEHDKKMVKKRRLSCQEQTGNVTFQTYIYD